ncbi:pilus assembly protein [Cohnella algarum]|uniref:pilus assembly protein n=1 Tax=Cohnella algarum TaxID=2044859 RepID=UPI001967B8F5|nr:pilus assembly protein [Cohnella algarum]MBN2980065.1 pilus assembly protein [Cohnella algarum]
MSSLKKRRLPFPRRLLDSSGSFALEASMVVPIIMMLTFVALFFAIFIAQGAILYYNVSIAGERAAFNWSNSNKEFRTGAYPNGVHDGLYWRLTDDRLLAGLFGQAVAESDSGVPLPAEAGADEGNLALRKLSASAETIDSAATGEMSYRNSVIWREIATAAQSELAPEPLRRFNGTTVFGMKASAAIVEPAEFLRTIDLLRYYSVKIRNAAGGAAAYRKQAAGVLEERKSQ